MPDVEIVVKSVMQAGPGIDAAEGKVKQLTKSVQAIPDKEVKVKVDGDAAAQKVTALSTQLVAARRKEQDVAGEVRVAELKLAEVRQDSGAKASAVAAAEERLASAYRRAEAAQKDVGAISEKLNKARQEPVKVPVEVEDKTESGLSSVKGKLTGWVAGLGLGGLIGEAISDGLDKTNITSHLQNQMGASAEVAAQAGQTAGRVFSEGFVKDQGVISDAISSLSSDVKGWSDLTQDEQQKIASGATKLGATFNTDVTEVIAAASSMVNNNLAPDFNSAFDLITAGFQNVGSRGDDLLDTLKEYSGYFTQLGLSGEEAMGLITQMMKAGARDTDYAADALKEFGIRAIDGSEQTAAGFEAVGLNAKYMSEQIGKGGESAKQGLVDVIKALQAMKDPVDQNIAGTALFGTQWEDTLRRVLPSLDTTKLKLEGVAGATNRLVSELTPKEEIGRAWDTLTNGVATGLVGAAKGVRGFGETLGDVFTLRIFDSDYDGLGLKALMADMERAKNGTGFFKDVVKMVPPEMRSWAMESRFTNDALKDTTVSVHGLSDAILGLANKDLGYRQSVAATKSAEDALKDALKGHKAGSEEVTTATMGLESAQLRQIQAAEDLAKANSKAKDDAGRVADAVRGGATELVKMAEASGGRLTPALYQLMAGMDQAALAAAGVTITVDKAGQAVYRLPDGKTIKMTADDQASRRAKEVSDYIQGLPPFKTINLTVNELIRTGFTTIGTVPGSMPMSQGRKASGGVVGAHAAEGGPRSGAVQVNEQGIEIYKSPRGDYAALEPGGMVIPHGESASLAGAGPAPVIRLVIDSSGSRMDDLIVELLRKAVRTQGGNVQAVLGS